MSERAVKHVRKALGEFLRSLRKDRGLSQQRLGQRSGLSGKFIGEVERGVKSISIDGLYHIAVALDVTLRDLVDMSRTSRKRGTTPELEKLSALLSELRNREHGGSKRPLLGRGEQKHGSGHGRVE